MIKTSDDPEPILKKITAVGNIKQLYNEIANSKVSPSLIGSSIQILGPANMMKCVQSTSIDRFFSILSAGSIETTLLKYFMESKMNPAKAVNWISQQNLKSLVAFLEVIISANTKIIPKPIIDLLEDQKLYSTQKNLVNFLLSLESEWIKPEILKYLRHLLESGIDGRNLALLIEAGLNLEKATTDVRYMIAIFKLLKAGVDAEHVIILMTAKKTVFRLIEADESLIPCIANVVSKLLLETRVNDQINQAAELLSNCTESARLREILIDDHFNNILVGLIAQGIQGKHIGIFLSQTGLSIKETQTFSPDGYSIRYDIEFNA